MYQSLGMPNSKIVNMAVLGGKLIHCASFLSLASYGSLVNSVLSCHMIHTNASSRGVQRLGSAC